MSAASTAERTAAQHTGTTIVIGLGNPILGDDGAGWLVADAVEATLGGTGGARGGGAGVGGGARPDVVVERLAVGGLTLMEHLVGFRRAILVDAVVTGSDPPGTVRRLPLEALPGGEAGHVDSSHDATLRLALEAGRALGASLPDKLEIVTIEAATVLEVGEVLTPAVAVAIPVAADLVLRLLAG
jgi:hydrogenase maturation protease